MTNTSLTATTYMLSMPFALNWSYVLIYSGICLEHVPVNAPGTPTCDPINTTLAAVEGGATYEDALAGDALKRKGLVGGVLFDWYFDGDARANRDLCGTKEGGSGDRKSTRLNSSHSGESRMPSSA